MSSFAVLGPPWRTGWGDISFCRAGDPYDPKIGHSISLDFELHAVLGRIRKTHDILYDSSGFILVSERFVEEVAWRELGMEYQEVRVLGKEKESGLFFFPLFLEAYMRHAVS